MSEDGTLTSAGEDAPAPRGDQEAPGFAVVGIGASAGGLEAFRALFSAMPAETGMAFIVVQHLSREHPSILAQALQRLTTMAVVEAENGGRLWPDHVYVMPANAEVVVREGLLRLLPRPASSGVRLPIDGLFQSLGEELRSRAIGVVLSGTGEDGTAGLKDIKAGGGITFAQAPASAQFSGMPASAISAGVVDRVLAPDLIARELAQLSRHPYLTERAGDEQTVGDHPVRILALVRRQSGVDFSMYRPSTIRRRIARRMALHRIGSIGDYGDLVERDPGEAKALSEDLLIHVTGFFRDPEVFEALKLKVFPALLATPREAPFRFWVVGCASGEEVYSLAMCFLDHLGDTEQEVEFQIFGSDLSDRAIERARAAVYSRSALGEMSEERLARYFTRAGSDLRIAKNIRDRCVFVVHDVARDPPFARLDLISCRNVLIYFGEELHQRLLTMFHYCLARPGFLLLGSSENVISAADLFVAVEPRHRIFERVGEGRRPAPTLPVTTRAVPMGSRPGLSRSAAEAQRQADQLLLSRLAPPGVVVNERLDVVHFRGRTRDYLEQPPGQPQTNLLKLARGSLLTELRRTVAQAKERGVAVRTEGIQLVRGDGARTISIEVLPLLGHREASEPYFLVLFHDGARVVAPALPVDLDPADPGVEVLRLREELSATKLYLESTVEQHQAVDDEFATVNEELVAANEELQSTNEELESAKEELQSANEELTTLNDELRGRNTELDRVVSDLSNVLVAADIPMVIVDAERRIRRYTPETRGLFSLIASDMGRPIDDIKLNFDATGLDGRIREVIQRAEPGQWEVQDLGGAWFRMHIRPYRAGEGLPSGAILSFVDITVLKGALGEASSAGDFARAIVENVPVPLLVVDADHRVVMANPAFESAFGNARAGHDLFLALQGVFDLAELRRATEEATPGGRQPPIEFRPILAGLTGRTFAVTIRAVGGARPVKVLAFEDLTQHRRFEEERLARAAAEASNSSKDLFLAMLSHELRTPLSTILLQTDLLLRDGEAGGRVERAASAIHRAAALQKRLIDDLLDVSRIVSGKLVLDQTALDLGAVVEAAVDEARIPAAAKGLDLGTTIEPGRSDVFADPERIQQVIANLLTNAIKFTPRGGTVSVVLRREGEDVRVTIRDSGNGIRPEFLPHLFTRFSQADSSLTRAYGGLGLGLAIVKHLVDRHGGTVGADSPGVGQGATFWVTLPLMQAPAELQGSGRLAGVKVDIEGLRVLVVDDDDDARESVAEVLRSAGAQVRAVASAGEAMAALKASPPDVLLSDLAMQGEDGFSLIARVRGLPPEEGGRIPAAALSAFAGVEDQRHSVAAGYQLHLTKPVNVDGLLSAVAWLAALPRS